MTDVANDGLVFHGGHVFVANHVFVAGGRHKNVGFVSGVFHGHHFVAFHRRLQGVDRVDFSHPHLGAQSTQGLGRTFAHVAITGHQSHFASDHHVGRTLDGVDQRFAAAVEVVEFALGDGVVHVDGAEHQAAFGGHFVQAQHAGGGLFGHADDVRSFAAVPSGVLRQLGFDGVEQTHFFFAARVAEQRGVFFSTLAQVHEQGGVAAIVQDHVGAFAIGIGRAKFKNAVGVIPVVVQGFALVGKHRCAIGHQGRSSMVLGGEDVARSPTHLGAQSLQCFNQHGGLDGHVQRAGDASAFQGLGFGELLANRHEAGHFGLGDFDFFAAPIGQGHVGDVEVGGLGGFQRCIHGEAPKGSGPLTRHASTWEDRGAHLTLSVGERGWKRVRASRH